MKSNAVAFGTGALFAVGLAVSGMTRPSKVVAFLDVAGAWDASLAFVMIGAIAVHFVARRLVMRRGSPLFDSKFHLPVRTAVDARLLIGAALFGIGWGLGGLCPGPAIVSAGGGSPSALVFLAGMTIGMLLEHSAANRFSGMRLSPGTQTLGTRQGVQ